MTLTLPSEYHIDKLTSANRLYDRYCGELLVTMSGIPAGSSYLKVDFLGNKVSGSFPTQGAVVSTSGESEEDHLRITGVEGKEQVVLSIPLPAGQYGDLLVSSWDESGKPLKAEYISFGKNVLADDRHAITASQSAGVFSIGAGKYAIFSPGNLLAVTTCYGQDDGWKWQFASPEYSFVGATSGNVCITNEYGETDLRDCSVDLYCWSTWNCYGIANTTKMYLYEQDFFMDWGAKVDGPWRTPSGGPNGEWTYVFHRDAAKFARATVAGVHGVILLPDSFTDPKKNNGSGAFAGGASQTWEANQYDADGWTAMSEAGAVFLPAAGARFATEVLSAGDLAVYWSSTPFDKDNSWSFYFRADAQDFDNYHDLRYGGYAVRLILDVE